MEKFSDIIKVRLGTHGLSASARAAEVLHASNQLLTSLLKADGPAVKAYRLHQGVLYIAAENPSWSQEVWAIQRSVLGNLTKRFGKGVVKKIQIKSLTIK
ncbi:DUF721 domain-containing protein [Candidatus Peregrinibacteria bacterium]|nr:DUF721 domain-containing protein [Candidatus Peregrinibacteria bacterium]